MILHRNIVHTSRGKKRWENPRTLAGCSSPRAIRPRSRTLSNAERVVTWPVEDGIWGFGGGVLVVEWCLVQNNESEKTAT